MEMTISIRGSEPLATGPLSGESAVTISIHFPPCEMSELKDQELSSHEVLCVITKHGDLEISSNHSHELG